ncbi:hypothetical protein DE146DRAFT_498333 [Phaeosphaeria sp. MPI-PUGE-AT-0046c]|nr:hypothetical protein DE146DRAFT_498333 [Phaeosphaeria sp. MPI-PUGE-AT-0046c]
MACTASPVPAPPTSLPACAIPIGGSNTTILDTCCNGHINAMATYSAPGSSSNAKSDNGCFQYCVTDSPDYVAGCLTNTLGEFESSVVFECFNTQKGKKGEASKEERGYGSGAGKVGGRVGWGMGSLVVLGFVGAVVGII